MTYNLAGVDEERRTKFDQIKEIIVKSIDDDNYADKADDIQRAKEGLSESEYKEIYTKIQKKK